ncbi:hypothetical protein [Candidatus Cyanaurora vandensis]|uniref:hypothetical protein n=1 Tax=Candidatus Cyanaurora vandensis TaxID=2714958 RepID=UPI00257C1420|nr:hypothetical protein [Candidatus Cyanaurora vandensis]
MKAWLVLFVGLGLGLPVSAGRVRDTVSNISFVPPPYFQTSFGAKGSTVHYLLTPPDKHVTIYTGALLDRKFTTVRPMDAQQIKALCNQAKTVLFPKGLTLGLNKRFLVDGQNGAECRFSNPSGQLVRWIGIPEAGQLVYAYADWPKPPNEEQVDTFRMFLGSIQIF